MPTMHQSSMETMVRLVEKYQALLGPRPRICDVGATDICGSYRSIFEGWTDYHGIDLAPGRNVDAVVAPYEVPGTWDAVLCGQVLEHTEDMPRLVRAIFRATRSGGYCFLAAPSEWPEHRHPLDCWRLLPDGMRWLLAEAGFEVVEAFRSGTDCWGVGRRPEKKESARRLSAEEKNVVDAFARLFYARGGEGGTWNDLCWLGVRALKNPFDLWIYQELIGKTAPDVIIETGTFMGGSALYLASVMDAFDRGRIISIDIAAKQSLPRHPRVEFVAGSSVSSEIFEMVKMVKAWIGPTDRVMAILDSNHNLDHVLTEMRLWGQLVTPGCYMVVEDGCVNGHPVLDSHGPGPLEAIEQFMSESTDFVVDESQEKLLFTFNPKGYLLRR